MESLKQESRAIARKPREAATVRFGLSSPTFTTSLSIGYSQALCVWTGAKQNLT